jgi:ketopantoate reductase
MSKQEIINAIGCLSATLDAFNREVIKNGDAKDLIKAKILELVARL